MAPNETGSRALSRQPLLVELATRMKTRVATRIERDARSEIAKARMRALERRRSRGAAVLDRASRESRATSSGCCSSGAGEVLVLPSNATAPQRVLIHWVDEAARRATLAVSASLLRHVHG